MNNGKVITLAQIAETIRKSTDVPVNEVEKFVVALTEEIAMRLAEGEHVEVPGLGTFAVVNTDDGQILWRPDDTLQQEVNAPFAFFEPVELADGVTENTLQQIPDQTSDNGDRNSLSAAPSVDEANVEEAANEVAPSVVAIETEPETEPEPVPVDEVLEQTPEEVESESVENVPEQNNVAIEETFQDDSQELVPEQPKGRFGWLELLLGLAIGLVVGFIAAVYSPNPQLIPIRSALSGSDETEAVDIDSLLEEASSTLDVLAAETAPEVVHPNADTATVPEPIAQPKVEKTDTVTSTRFLTTMARQYFGDYHFWVYIYLYNKDIITDPDRIAAGTVVRIPDASVYAIDASSPASIEKAQSLIESLKNKQ